MNLWQTIVVTLVLVLPAVAPAQQPLSPNGPWSGKVVRVVDGDTIVVDLGGIVETVRIIGIDTPETVDPRKPVQAFGKEASDYTKRTLTGKIAKLESDPANIRINHRDRYGRLLVYVWVGETFFNEKIIRDGFAHAYTKYPFRQDYMDLFRKAEKEARDGKRGLWGDQSSESKKPDR